MKKEIKNTNTTNETINNEAKENTMKIRKYERKPIAEEVKLVNEFLKQIRRNSLTLTKMVVAEENKEEYIERINKIFDEANKNISQIVNELHMKKQIQYMTDDQKELLKKMLNA